VGPRSAGIGGAAIGRQVDVEAIGRRSAGEKFTSDRGGGGPPGYGYLIT